MFEMKKKLSWIADADADADADSQVNMMGAQVVQGCLSLTRHTHTRCGAIKYPAPLEPNLSGVMVSFLGSIKQRRHSGLTSLTLT